MTKTKKNTIIEDSKALSLEVLNAAKRYGKKLPVGAIAAAISVVLTSILMGIHNEGVKKICNTLEDFHFSILNQLKENEEKDKATKSKHDQEISD